MGSGDSINAGQITTAESTTDLVGATRSEEDVDFNGKVILRVGPQRERLQPESTIDGIHGLGNGSSNDSPHAFGGKGVAGFGGQGAGKEGAGGTGVHGIGGSQIAVNTVDPKNSPGVGVIGQGGRMDDTGNITPRRSHGAGVVGIAGGAGLPLPLPLDTEGAGVYGEGDGSAGVYGIGEPGVRGIGGPVGVIGKGGRAGVWGTGSQYGVDGDGKPGRGGIFESLGPSAQVQLVPHYLPQNISNQIAITPIAFSPGKGPALRRDGVPGDLQAIQLDAEGNRPHCTLWLCVERGSGSSPARWAQVLVGPAFDGVA